MKECHIDRPSYGQILPQDYKSQNSSHAFKGKIRKWNAEICECRLLKHYEGNLGFI